MPPKVKIGDIVVLTFLDHVEDGEGPILFCVAGRVSEVTRKHIAVCSWWYADQPHTVDENVKRFDIVRGAMKRIDVATLQSVWTVKEGK
jgi:hypothetical protein